MIQLDVHPEGIVIAVRAYPGSRRDEFRGEYAGALKVAVTQAPEKGKANQAIAELLATHLHVRKSQIELLSGATNSQKRFLIRGASENEIRARLEDR